jgi:hypothetical protein
MRRLLPLVPLLAMLGCSDTPLSDQLEAKKTVDLYVRIGTFDGLVYDHESLEGKSIVRFEYKPSEFARMFVMRDGIVSTYVDSLKGVPWEKTPAKGPDGIIDLCTTTDSIARNTYQWDKYPSLMTIQQKEFAGLLRKIDIIQRKQLEEVNKYSGRSYFTKY